MSEEKNIKNPAVMAELFKLPYCTSGTVLESKLSHCDRKRSTVSFRNSAIPAAKTIKNSSLVTFTNEKNNRILFLMFLPLGWLSSCRGKRRKAPSVGTKQYCAYGYGARARSQALCRKGSTGAQRAQPSQRGFLCFFFTHLLQKVVIY